MYVCMYVCMYVYLHISHAQKLCHNCYHMKVVYQSSGAADSLQAQVHEGLVLHYLDTSAAHQKVSLEHEMAGLAREGNCHQLSGSH